MRVKAIRQILKVCNDALSAHVLAVASMKGKPMVDICWIAIDKLMPNGRNARTHSRKQIHQIADSIEAFGFVVPILIDDDGIIIAGHGRYAAAKLLDLKQVPRNQGTGAVRSQAARPRTCRQQDRRKRRLGPRAPGNRAARCPSQKSYPHVAVMQSFSSRTCLCSWFCSGAILSPPAHES
jgi:ParB-like nuclease domain